MSHTRVTVRRHLAGVARAALLLGLLPAFAWGAPAAKPTDLLEQTRELDNRTQALKKDVLELGRNLAYLAWVGGVRQENSSQSRGIVLSRDMLKLGETLARLEDGLLAPPGIQLVLFVSAVPPRDFELQQLELKLGRDLVAQRKYSSQEIEALRHGGAHRLYIGNIPEGSNRLLLTISGLKDGKPYTQYERYNFNKYQDRQTIEAHIGGSFGKPTVNFKEWD